MAKQCSIKDQNRGGKELIGPMALANNIQIFSEMFKVGFLPNGIVKALGMTRLYDSIDKDNKKTRNSIEAGINGGVDIAKDQWPFDINLGSYTYDLGILLMRTGWGRHAGYFLK